MFAQPPMPVQTLMPATRSRRPRRDGLVRKVKSGDRITLEVAGTSSVIHVDGVGRSPVLRIEAPAEVIVQHLEHGSTV